MSADSNIKSKYIALARQGKNNVQIAKELGITYRQANYISKQLRQRPKQLEYCASPEEINACLNCKRNTCPGDCAALTELKRSKYSGYRKLYTAEGESHTMPEWAQILGVTYYQLRNKFNTSADFESAVAKIRSQKGGREHG